MIRVYTRIDGALASWEVETDDHGAAIRAAEAATKHRPILALVQRPVVPMIKDQFIDGGAGI